MSSLSSHGEQQNADESSAFYANNDASSYNTRYLKSIRNKERFQELHFFQCDEELIDELIPKKPGKGTLTPPAVCKASAAALHQWRDMDEAEQLRMIEQEKSKAPPPQQQQIKVDTSSGGPATGTAGTASDLELKRSLSNEQGQGDGNLNFQVDPAAPPAKFAKLEHHHIAPSAASSVAADFPVRWTASSKDINIDFRKDRLCRGITSDFLRKNYPNDLQKMKGFAFLVGASMKQKMESYSKNLCWPFACDPRVAGCLVNKEGDDIVLTWICVQLAENKDGDHIVDELKYEGIHFYHPTCDRSSTSLHCECCKAHAKEFLNLCGAIAQN